jgi:peptidoglycan/xylan/chitin deacetylase (PgdA/CDA1 family)
MYHYVRPDADVPGALSPARFRDQLDRLHAQRRLIDVDSWLRVLRGENDLPRDAALLTFDDGLRDHVDVVLPELIRRSLSAAFFVQTDPTENRCLEAAHMNHLLLGAMSFETLLDRFERALDELQPRARLAHYVDQRQALQLYHYETPARALYKYAVAFGLPIELRDRLLTILFERFVGEPDEWAARLYPTWDEWRAAQSLGMHIGGHSHRHDPYTRLTPEQQRGDVRRCAAILEERLGPRPRAFAYPFGRFNDETCRTLRDAGFAAGFTTQPQPNAGAVDPWRIGRIDCIHLEQHLSEVPHGRRGRPL